MPSHRDVQVSVDTAAGAIKALLRDHHIGVWPAAAMKIRQQITPELQAPDATK